MTFRSFLGLSIISSSIISCGHLPDRVVIEGLVKSEKGAPIAGVEIDVFGPSVFTNNDGYFCYEHRYPPNNLIHLIIAPPGGQKHEEALEFGSYELKIVAPDTSSSRSVQVERRLQSIDFSKGFYCSPKLDPRPRN